MSSRPAHNFDCVLVTGASSGIGAALALRLARPGCVLALIGRNEKRLKQVGEACEKKGSNVMLGAIDITDLESMRKFMQEVDQTRRLDLVVANAGIFPAGVPAARSLLDVANINIIGTLNTVNIAVECMSSRPGGEPRGHLAIMSSLSAIPAGSVKFAGGLSLDLVPYTWSKRSVFSLAEGLREAYREMGIQVTTICPGIVMSDLALTTSKAFGNGEALEKTAMKADEAADKIVQGLMKGKEMIAFPKRAVLGMKLMELMPQRWLVRQVKKRYLKNDGGLAHGKQVAPAIDIDVSAGDVRS